MASRAVPTGGRRLVVAVAAGAVALLAFPGAASAADGLSTEEAKDRIAGCMKQDGHTSFFTDGDDYASDLWDVATRVQCVTPGGVKTTCERRDPNRLAPGKEAMWECKDQYPLPEGAELPLRPKPIFGRFGSWLG